MMLTDENHAVSSCCVQITTLLSGVEEAASQPKVTDSELDAIKAEVDKLVCYPTWSSFLPWLAFSLLGPLMLRPLFSLSNPVISDSDGAFCVLAYTPACVKECSSSGALGVMQEPQIPRFKLPHLIYMSLPGSFQGEELKKAKEAKAAGDKSVDINAQVTALKKAKADLEAAAARKRLVCLCPQFSHQIIWACPLPGKCG